MRSVRQTLMDSHRVNRLTRRGFTQDDLASLNRHEVGELVRLSRAPAALVWTTAAAFFGLGTPVIAEIINAVTDPLSPASALDPPGAPTGTAAVMLGLAVVFFLSVIAGILAQEFAERFGDADRSLGISCRRLIDISARATTIRLARRRSLLRNAGRFRRRAARAGVYDAETAALLRAVIEGSPRVAPVARTFLVRHVRGVTIDPHLLASADRAFSTPIPGWLAPVATVVAAGIPVLAEAMQ